MRKAAYPFKTQLEIQIHDDEGVLAGPVLTMLSPEELKALLAHELAHYLLYEGWDGDYLTAADLVRGLANDVSAGPEYAETARFWNLYTELFCDRWALRATGDLGSAVRTLVKAQTGIAEVNAESYLRQATDIFRAGPVKAGQFTHPELYVHARALELWDSQGAAADDEIERLIQGSLGFESVYFPFDARKVGARANVKIKTSSPVTVLMS